MRNRVMPVLIVFAFLATPVIGGHDEVDVDARNGRAPPMGVVPFGAGTARRLQLLWAKHLSVDESVKNSIGMPLILIPPGKFRLSDMDDVTLTDAFYLGKTEVTQAQWSAVMGTTPWKEHERQGENRPATFVSWNDARTYCERLTAKEQSGTYRLPTEAEWEYACRAGTTTRFSFGDDASLLPQFAWCSENSKKAGEKYAHEVALKKPNPFGLFDMHGNVWEYCDGEYTSDPNKEERPRLVKTGGMRMAAGGSWDADLSHAYPGSGSAFYCRSDSRHWPVPDYGTSSSGFRVAWTPPAEKKPPAGSDK